MPLYKGEIGKTILCHFFRVEDGEKIDLDISLATTKELRVVKPSGTADEFALTFVADGRDGRARYITTTADDLDEAGLWSAQGHVSGDDFDYFSVEKTLLVGSVNPDA